MRGTLRLPSVLLVLVCASAAYAQWTTVGDGFEYRSFTVTTPAGSGGDAGPNNVFVSRMNRANLNCTLETTIGTGELYAGRETVRSQAGRYDDAINYWGEEWGKRNKVVVAVNGDFFNMTTGYPTGGQIQSGWYCESFTEFGGWSGMAWTLDRNVFMGGCVAHYRQNRIVTYLGSGTTQNFTAINWARSGSNDLIVYTSQYSDNTHTDNTGTEVLVELDQPLLVKPSPDMVTGTIRQIRPNLGSTPIPFDHVVLSGVGTSATALLANAAVGGRIGISVKIFDFYPQWESPGCSTRTGNDWTRTYSCVGGNFIYLAGGVGKYTTNAGLVVRNPRTAVAYGPDYIYFIVVDGRSSISVGMTMSELADFTIAYLPDVTDGYNQDGGGSSTMVVNGVVKNVPSDGSERTVANGIMMVNVLPKLTSPSFGVGNLVQTNTAATIRLGPGSNYAAVTTVAANTQGTVLAHSLGGVYAKGEYWWKCDFGGTVGWAQEDQLAFISGGRPPVITQQPVAQSVPFGSTVPFTVQATGEGTLGYQWQMNRVDLTDVTPYSGSATNALTITNVNRPQAGAYRCLVTNGYGTTPSSEVALTVRSPDFNSDGYVDMVDFAHLQLCLGTTSVTQVPSCADTDLSGDSAVTYPDVHKFKNCLSGDHVPPTAGCLSLP